MGIFGVASPQILQQYDAVLPFQHGFLYSNLSLRSPGAKLFLEQGMDGLPFILYSPPAPPHSVPCKVLYKQQVLNKSLL